MKIDLSKPAEVSTVKKTPYSPPYNKEEVNLQLCEPENVYLPHGIKHAEKYGVKLVASMQQAIDARKVGQFVLTYREADTAARGDLPLNSQFLNTSMVGPQALGVICEGIPGAEDNPFELRNQYNKGVQFYKTGKYAIAPEAQQKAANARMKSLRQKLDAANVPLWAEEEHEGFVQELLKPEYMSWHQYKEASSKKIFLFDPHASPEFDTAKLSEGE